MKFEQKIRKKAKKQRIFQGIFFFWKFLEKNRWKYGILEIFRLKNREILRLKKQKKKVKLLWKMRNFPKKKGRKSRRIYTIFSEILEKNSKKKGKIQDKKSKKFLPEIFSENIENFKMLNISIRMRFRVFYGFWRILKFWRYWDFEVFEILKSKKKKKFFHISKCWIFVEFV